MGKHFLDLVFCFRISGDFFIACFLRNCVSDSCKEVSHMQDSIILYIQCLVYSDDVYMAFSLFVKWQVQNVDWIGRLASRCILILYLYSLGALSIAMVSSSS